MRIVISASYGQSLVNFRGDLIKAMVRKGHEVICTSIEPESEMKEAIAALGAAYCRIPGTRTGINPLGNFIMLLSFIRTYRYLHPDLCFLYMSKPIAYGGLAALLCKVRRINLFITGLEVAFYSPGLKNFIVRTILILLYKIVNLKSEHIFFMNLDDYNKFLRLRLVKKAQAVIVNGSGVNLEYFERKPMPDRDVVCMIARLVWSKGIQEYVEAASIIRKRYPEVRFLLIGGLDENPEALSEQELNEILQSGIVEYYGYADDVRPFLQQCSIFVLPSYHEGNGRSIVEAEAVGRPVITTNSPGCRDTVVDGYNGFLIPVKDSTSLAEKIRVLLEHKELKLKMAENSYQLCSEKFDVKQINHIFLEQMDL